AIDHTRLGLAFGLGLIALGAGGIKPCVSANVGDQFGVANQHLLPRVFSWLLFNQPRFGLLDHPDSGIARTIRSENRFWNTGSLHAHRDRRLLVWTQEICPHSPRGRAQLLKGTFPIRKPEGPWESPDPHTVRG